MEKYIVATRAMYVHNFSLADFCDFCSNLQISIEWAIMSWASLKANQDIKGKPPRYLEPSMLGIVKLTTSNRSCRLCGLEVKPPKYTWHKECWDALYPFTSNGWQDQMYKAKRRIKNCQNCNKAAPLEGDHIIPIALGGMPYLENLQLLCSDCHKEKTASDMKQIREAKVIKQAAKNEP